MTNQNHTNLQKNDAQQLRGYWTGLLAGLLAGLSIGGLSGAAAMVLLTPPRAGKRTKATGR
jgi:predicted lipid-binding transport protein (Tim44 family)